MRRTSAGEQEKPKTKYNSQKTVLDLMTGVASKLTPEQYKTMKNGFFNEQSYLIFDSESECRYYREVLLPEIKDGKITVELQPKFTLLDKQRIGHIKHAPVTYTADFRVTENATGKVTIVDVKGMEDQKFPIKRKLFDHLFPSIAPLVVMKYVKKFGGWITAEQYAASKKEEKKHPKGSSVLF